jgi:hypothetical protein
MSIPPYPLAWPEGLPRTLNREELRVKATLPAELENVRTSLLFSARTLARQSPRAWYHRLWDTLHGPDAWAANPWVCALTFDVVRTNIKEVSE